MNLDRLEEDFFRGWVKLNPLIATDLGLHGDFDVKLPDGSVEAVEEQIRFLHKHDKLFKAVPAKKFPESRQVDVAAAQEFIRLRLFELEELRMWERVPEAPRMIGRSLFQLLVRNFAPLKERVQLVAKRLEGMPKYIDESRSRLRRPNKILIESELETITRLPGFFHGIKVIALNTCSIVFQNKIGKLIEDVHDELERYSDWLIIDVLSECPDWEPIGDTLYHRYLQVRGISESPSRLRTWGEEEATRLREKLREISKRIDRKMAVEDVRNIIRQRRPDHFDGVLKSVRDNVHKTRQFVQRSGFATLPPGESLHVIETPAYLRHMVPLGTYWPPAPLEEKKDGYFCVTPGDCDSDRLKEHNQPSLTNMAIHEGYPGHHLLASWAVLNRSKIRHLLRSPEIVEGWAHYCEERIRELGYESSAEDWFVMTEDLLFRAIRVVLDVQLHTGSITIPDAVIRLIDDVGMDRITCEAEVRRYLITPTQPLSYLYGKEQIKELKKWARERMKGRFQETFFHNELMKSGAMPMALLKRDLQWKIDEELAKPVAKEPPPKADKKNAAKAGTKGAPKAALKDAAKAPKNGVKPHAVPAKPAPKAKAKMKPRVKVAAKRPTRRSSARRR